MSTKLQEIADWKEGLGHQQARDHDAEKKQIVANDVDKRHPAAEKCVQEGDLVLLERRKENKLSPQYKEPYLVTARHGDQSHLKGVEYKRNIQHVRQFVTPVIESEQPSLADPVLILNERTSGQESTPSPEVGASGTPVVDCSPTQPQPLPRRLEGVNRPPERLSDYVTT